MSSDTIFALSSGAVKSGVAVFRLSGPRALESLHALCGREFSPREVHFSYLKDPTTKETIDSGVVFSFQKPASFTGEDMAEIQVHGSLAVMEHLSSVLLKMGIRQAEAGEFTLRAFRNNKLDLSQAEALSDLIDSETTLQKKQALVQSDGRLSKCAAEWREQLLKTLAPLEAGIDFPDEEDVPAQIEHTAVPVIERLQSALSDFIEDGQKARRIRNGITIVLIGPPNAGKSTFLNYISGSDVAIVSNIPGTTRDSIEVRLNIAGVPVNLIDTAGLRETPDGEIEEEGIRRAKEKAANADIRLRLFDSTNFDQHLLDDESFNLASDFLVLNKIDEASDHELKGMIRSFDDKEVFLVSLKTEQGVSELLSVLEKTVIDLCGNVEEPRLTRQRHIAAVQNAMDALSRASSMVNVHPELAAEDVRMAIRHLGEISGHIDVEDVLGEIFSSFCIGK